MKNQDGTNQADEGLKFLERDFNQCFEQMRHYDSQIIDLGKFAYTSYPVVIGGAAGIYKYGLDKHLDYSVIAGLIPLIAFLPGLFLLWDMVRTRVYFVRVTRYLNEHRQFFLSFPPLSFPNVAKMYVDPKKPDYLDRYSSQLYFMCILAVLNAFLLGVAVYIFGASCARPSTWAGIALVLTLAIQLVPALLHLRSAV